MARLDEKSLSHNNLYSRDKEMESLNVIGYFGIQNQLEW